MAACNYKFTIHLQGTAMMDGHTELARCTRFPISRMILLVTPKMMRERRTTVSNSFPTWSRQRKSNGITQKHVIYQVIVQNKGKNVIWFEHVAKSGTVQGKCKCGAPLGHELAYERDSEDQFNSAWICNTIHDTGHNIRMQLNCNPITCVIIVY